MFAIAENLSGYRNIKLYSYPTIGECFNRKSAGACSAPDSSARTTIQGAALHHPAVCRERQDLVGQRQLFDVIPLGGGVPIMVGDETIGAVGVSGSGGQQKDEDCAKGAIAKVADQLK